MSWYKDDETIITDEEFKEACDNCLGFHSEGHVSIPCDGNKEDCPYFRKV